MARRRQSKTQLFIVKFIFITLLMGGLGFGVASAAVYFFRNTEYFRIRSVIIDPALQFIQRTDLKHLIGKNIFEVDLKAVQRHLSYKYPQAAELKVIKHFPDQIDIVAKQRMPFAQIWIGEKIAIMDEDGVVLSIMGKAEKLLPLIAGAKTDNQRLVRGLPFQGDDIQTALQIAGYFQGSKKLSSYSLSTINVENLSKIYLTLSNDLQVVLDRDDIAQKIRVLEVVLSPGMLDMKEVKYVDLRFKEPIIGKK
ncbi:MAG: cell division protein FtsQ/DivIB [Candidatus Omnitrophica bacterium]|nr:cell division protein FtsQ/DivIB [Candidatus Omnitrophota bacterium]